MLNILDVSIMLAPGRQGQAAACPAASAAGSSPAHRAQSCPIARGAAAEAAACARADGDLAAGVGRIDLSGAGAAGGAGAAPKRARTPLAIAAQARARAASGAVFCCGMRLRACGAHAAPVSDVGRRRLCLCWKGAGSVTWNWVWRGGMGVQRAGERLRGAPPANCRARLHRAPHEGGRAQGLRDALDAVQPPAAKRARASGAGVRPMPGTEAAHVPNCIGAGIAGARVQHAGRQPWVQALRRPGSQDSRPAPRLMLARGLKTRAPCAACRALP